MDVPTLREVLVTKPSSMNTLTGPASSSYSLVFFTVPSMNADRRLVQDTHVLEPRGELEHRDGHLVRDPMAREGYRPFDAIREGQRAAVDARALFGLSVLGLDDSEAFGFFPLL